jgi:hypothetical protein
LNAAIPTSIATATSPDAGALTGAEEITTSRGTGVLQTALTTIAQWVIQTYQGFTQGVTGAVARTVSEKLADSVSVEDFGLVGDGSDETAKLTTAITYAATNKLPLYWPAGKTYSFTNINVLVGGGLFNWLGSCNLKQLSARNPALPAVEIGGEVIADGMAVASTPTSQSSIVTLSSAAQVQPGYLLRLMTNRLAYGDHRFDPNNCFGQLVKVQSVSGNIVQLLDTLVFPFPVASITTGTAQGGTSGTITLAAGDASTENQLKNYLLTITAGTGAGQSRYINTYNATTKVADIGTTYTGFPQAPWSVIPDSTSVYSVSSTVTARIIQPAHVKSLANMVLVGYRQPSVVNYGLQVAFCDGALVQGCDISECSQMSLYTYQSYRTKVIGNRFKGANFATSGGGGDGFGHVSLGEYACVVMGNTAENCQHGFESVNATMYLTRIGNTVTGGGLSYDMVTPMWPANVNFLTSGLSSHSASFGVTDVGNTTCDVYDNKQRGMWQTFSGNTMRGRMAYCVQPSYCTGATYVGNVYDDGMTNQPTTGLNGDVNGNDGFPIVTDFTNRPTAFMNIRYNTMVQDATVIAKGNVVKCVNTSFAFITDCAANASNDSPLNLSLTVTDNDTSIITSGSSVLGVVKDDGTGAPNLLNFTAYHNILHVGGASLGSVKADNMNKYPFLADMTITVPMTFQTGVNQWLCVLQANTITGLPIAEGQNTFKLTIFEKDSAVPNYFSGIVQRGNTTPIATFSNSGVSFSTGSPTGTGGTAGNLNFFVRTDAMYLNNQTSSTGNFVVLIEGIL